MKKKVYIIAGEVSGDNIGSKLISHLKSIANLEFYGIGGDNMMREGKFKSLFPIEKINLFGFWEIILHIFSVMKCIKSAIKHIKIIKPDIIITVDSPGFCFRVVKKLRALGCQTKIIHVVAPTVWAYKPERAQKIAKIYDHLLTILPFEAEFFEKWGLKTSYIGYPIFEQNFNIDTKNFQLKHNISDNQKIICITPGSRSGEIKRLLPIFLNSLKIVNNLFNNFRYIIVVAKNNFNLVKSITDEHQLETIITDQKIEAFKVSKIALAKSGTNTLEIAACKTPMVVAYKLSSLTWWYLKRLLKVKYASLINIIANKEIIPEFIQDNCTHIKLSSMLIDMIQNPKLCEYQQSQTIKILEQMGLNGNIPPTYKAAQIIAKLI